VSAQPTSTDPRDEEIAALRARVAQLEGELAAQSRATATTVAEAQEKLYWLERWHVDLDAVMRKPGAVPALETLKKARGVARAAKKARRKITG
jgi:hypothetical protein